MAQLTKKIHLSIFEIASLSVVLLLLTLIGKFSIHLRKLRCVLCVYIHL